jgi:cold shock CspA family protein
MMLSRISGKVVFYNPKRSFGKINGNDGIFYIVRHSNVSTQNVYGLRFLLAGETVEFTPHRTDARNEALAVSTVRQPEQYDENYREDATVTAWNPRYGNGFARRATGDSLHLDKRDVISFGELTEGTEFRFKPAPPKHGYAWCATEIQIYQD